MKCFTCNKEKDLETCASGREVLKINLVEAVLELTPIYLSEENYHKTGRKPKLTATEQDDIKCAYRNGTSSMGKLAKKYDVSTATNLTY